MQLTREKTVRKGAAVLLATAVTAAIACSDLGRSPVAPHESTPTSDFVAAGIMYNAIWQPTPSGLAFAGSVSVPITLSSKAGVVTSSTGAWVAASDAAAAYATASARRLAFKGMMQLSRGSSPTGQISRSVLKARNLGKKTINGQEIRLAAVPDDDKKSGRPPKAMLTIVDGRIAAIAEFQYARKSGAWRPTQSRTTFLDRSGGIRFVLDHDAGALDYRSETELGNRGIQDRVDGVLTKLAQLAQPDALYAASKLDEGDWCFKEWGFAVAAAGAVLAQALEWEGRKLLVSVARLALTAGLLLCAEQPETCGALLALRNALNSAEFAVDAAIVLLGSLTATSLAMDAALAWCQTHPPETEIGPSGGGGGETGCDNGTEEEWCQWTISFSGGTIHVSQDYCWCEEEYAT